MGAGFFRTRRNQIKRINRNNEARSAREENDMGGLSIWHWLIVLVVVLLIFGTKKLRNIGTDLGGAVKGFKDGIKDGAERPADGPAPQVADRATIDVEAREKTKS